MAKAPVESERADFDEYSRTYEEALKRGIDVSGESRQFFAEGRIRYLAGILKQFQFPVRSAMDFGCGTGSSVPLLFDAFSLERLTAVDVSQDSLQMAAQRNLSFSDRLRTSTECNSDSGNVDLVYCNGVFHHIPQADRPAAFARIYKVLRPGGYFSLWENNPWSPGARYVMSRIPFDREAVMLWPQSARRMAQDAGFRIVRTDFIFIFPRFLSILRPLERLLSKLPMGAQYQVLCHKVD